MLSNNSALFLLASVAMKKNKNNIHQENSSMKILEKQQRKINNKLKKKFKLTHFVQ